MPPSPISLDNRTKAIVGISLAIFGFFIFSSTLVRSLAYTNSDEQEMIVAIPRPDLAASPTPSSRQAYSYSQPTNLNIPSISLSAPIIPVGIGKSGNMAVPKTYTEVGWYKYGPKPGESGSAVLDGHVDNGLGLAGVFKKLSQLKVGDDIYIYTENGEEVRFQVTDIHILEYDTKDTAGVFDKTGPPRLSLITCDGVWIPEKKTYNKRLIVTAS